MSEIKALIGKKGEQKGEARPTIWREKLICNDCPRLNSCDAVVEWFDPEYSMATYIEGIGFDTRYGTKDNKCPYQKGEKREGKKMDLISRQDAIDAVHKEFDECLVWDESGQYTADEVESILYGLPSAQPTLYGYDIEHLALIARVMIKENVSPQKVIEILGDAKRVVKMVLDEQAELVEREVGKWT